MTIRNEEYKKFSWDYHSLGINKPLSCQIELTYACPLHCQHCYVDCYNKDDSSKNILSTVEVKKILDKCKKAGVLWLCLTGGDPLTRNDFIEIYRYALKLGFITTVFSSLAFLKEETLQTFKKHPPFIIETTLNSTEPKRYSQITKTKLLDNQINNIKILLQNRIKLKIKTQITKQNINEIETIKRRIESLGLKFRPNIILHSRLNHDNSPYRLRIEAEDALRVKDNYGHFDEGHAYQFETKIKLKDLINKPKISKLLICAAGKDSFWIDTQGRMFLCECLRKPYYNLMKKNNSVLNGFYLLNQIIQKWKFNSQNKCFKCYYRLICHWCPARAYLETKNLRKPIKYFCDLTFQTLKANRVSPLNYPFNHKS